MTMFLVSFLKTLTLLCVYLVWGVHDNNFNEYFLILIAETWIIRDFFVNCTIFTRIKGLFLACVRYSYYYIYYMYALEPLMSTTESMLLN